MDDFAQNASTEEKVAFLEAIGNAANLTGASKNGYRLITNIGGFGHQEITHLHAHILGGEPIGPMRVR